MPRVAWACTVAALASGCGLLLDVDGTWDAGAGAEAGAADASAAHDATGDDALARVDAGPPGCGPTLEGDLLAHYRFDGDPTDSLGAGPAGVGVGPLAYTETSSPCGHVLEFPRRTEPDSGYVVLPRSELWRMPEGAIDLRVRIDELPPGGAGILSRDAAGATTTEAGHVTLYITRSGQLAVRIQNEMDVEDALCTHEPLPIGEWVHIGINVGAIAEMFVDGRRAELVEPLESGSGMIVFNCVATLTMRPVDGNDEPWVIGASSWRSTAGSPTPISDPFIGAIDDLRFWRGPVDFARP